MVEPLIKRHALARLLGAHHIWHPHDLATEGAKYPVAFECSSRNEAFALLQQQMQPQGRICITADGNIEPLVLTPDFHEKELQVIGSSDGWDYHEHAHWYFNEIQRHPTCLEQIFERHIARHELISTFEHLASGVIQPLKVAVCYGKASSIKVVSTPEK